MNHNLSTAPSKRTWRQRIRTYCVLLVGLYVVYCGLLFFFQHKLIFPADMAGVPSATAAKFYRPEVIELATDEGVTRGWYLPAPDEAGLGDGPRPLVVFFHGNAELIDHQSAIIEMYHAMGISVLLPEYRGYGISEGSPSEKHIVGDATVMLERVLARPEIDRERVVLHGRSIGGGMAAQAADRLQAEGRKPAAVIVESTFVSASGMAWKYGVPPMLVRSPLRTGEVFERSAYPILIMHGKYDGIIPVSHAHELLKLAPNGKLLILEYGHGIPPQDVPLYEQALRMHLDEAGVVRGNDP